MDFKDIHIGNLIKQKLDAEEIDTVRVCNFLKCNSTEIEEMLASESIDTKKLLSWSKLLEYDFFRIYSHNILLFSPQKGHGEPEKNVKKTKILPKFRKNLYTVEIIEYILDVLVKGEKTIAEVIEDYKIPKSTLHKWLDKYQHKGDHNAAEKQK